MKTIFLVAGCRAGLEFFQSLLDGHEEILQFPGIIKTNKELIKILSLKNSEEISWKPSPLFLSTSRCKFIFAGALIFSSSIIFLSAK